MKNSSKLLVVLPLAAIIGMIAAPAHAVTIDLRHEVTDVSDQNKDRVMISHRFGNGFGFSVETKTKSGGDAEDQPWTDNVSNGAEFSVNWAFKPFDGWTIQPGFNWETSSSKSIYKPYIRIQYDFDCGLYAAFRYRYEYTRDPDSTTASSWHGDEHVNRPEVWLGYKYGDWRLELNYLQKRSDDKIRYNNRKWDYEYDAKLSYKITKEWTVYGQIGNISVKSTSAKRQNRYRMGVLYSF